MIFCVTQFHPLTESTGSTQTALWIERKIIKNIGVYIIYTNIMTPPLHLKGPVLYQTLYQHTWFLHVCVQLLLSAMSI